MRVVRNETRTAALTESGQADFESFFRAQHPRLFQMAYLLTGDRAEAADIAQEAMVRVYERWDRVRRMKSPEGYAYRVAVNLHRRRLRSLVRLGRRSAGVPTRDPGERVETRTDVMRALLALPAGQRAALVLVEWLGMTGEEAGRVLGLKAGSVRARLHRARTALREALGEGYA